MRFNRIILFLCLITVVISSFIKIPYLSSPLVKFLVLLCAYLVSKSSAYVWEKKIQLYQTDIIVDGIQIYKLPYQVFGSHNAMVFKGKKHNIIVEEGVLNNLSEQQKKQLYIMK